MRIRELRDGLEVEEDERAEEASGGEVVAVVRLKAKRALVGAGARFLFYPTLLYNVVRNRFEPEFRWWDSVDQVLVFCPSPSPSPSSGNRVSLPVFWKVAFVFWTRLGA
jgi:atypical dual specificity phosphatase